jgi:hypothetical protein
MTYAADDYESIRRHLEELKALRDFARTGSTLPEETKVGEVATGWPMYGYTAPDDLA